MGVSRLLLSRERSNDVSMGNSCRAIPCFSIDSAFQVFGLSQRCGRKQMSEQELLEQQARQDFIDGVITAIKIDELISALIKGEN